MPCDATRAQVTNVVLWFGGELRCIILRTNTQPTTKYALIALNGENKTTLKNIFRFIKQSQNSLFERKLRVGKRSLIVPSIIFKLIRIKLTRFFASNLKYHTAAGEFHESLSIPFPIDKP